QAHIIHRTGGHRGPPGAGAGRARSSEVLCRRVLARARPARRGRHRARFHPQERSTMLGKLFSATRNPRRARSRRLSFSWERLEDRLLLSNQPDLVVRAASAPPTALVGDTLSVPFTVLNQGDGNASGYWSDGLYLSDTPTFDAGTARFLADTPNHPALAAGASYDQTFTVSSLRGTPGDRYLLIVANPFHALAESALANNVRAVPITLTAPDLAVTTAAVNPTTAEAGNNASVTVSWTVKNQGNVSARTPVSDAVYISDHSTLDA